MVSEKAEETLTAPIPHITDAAARQSVGTIHDYYSNGDYWWPNPDTADGLPYIRRDGETNPGNFNDHRFLLRRMRTNTVYLTTAYHLTGKEDYAARAVQILKEFFLDEATMMNPHLAYAQAIPGICDGRGIGIIDTLHLADIPFAIEALRSSAAMTDDIYLGLKDWFARYLGWMLTDKNGIAEMTEKTITASATLSRPLSSPCSLTMHGSLISAVTATKNICCPRSALTAPSHWSWPGPNPTTIPFSSWTT